MSVMTANGPIPASELGVTMMHEHIYVNLMREFRGTGLLNDRTEALLELKAYRELGGQSIVDATPAELSWGAAPDPGQWRRPVSADNPHQTGTRTEANALALRDLSIESGVHLILGTGHYRDPHLKDSVVQNEKADEVAERMVRDIEIGFGSSEIRAGIIGEIGSERWFISDLERRSFIAAARAHMRTGVPITTHAARWPNGVLQLELLGDEGVEPCAIVVGHCDTVPLMDYHAELAARGVFVQFDTFRHASGFHFERRVEFIRNLVQLGYEDRILVSHDVCETTHLQSNGGHGFTVIPVALRERLEALKMADVFELITVENPRRVFEGRS